MSSLTETAYYTRKGLKFGAIFLVVFLLLRAIFIQAVKVLTPPPPPPTPSVCFGKIPAIKFPDSTANPPFYPRLETLDNQLPSLPNMVNLYFIPKQSFNLFTLERAKNWANQLGFLGEPETIGESVQVYKTPNLPTTTLKLNIIYENFSLVYDYQSDFTLIGLKNSPGKEQAISEARGFFQRTGVLTPDLANGSQDVVFLKYNPPNLEPAIAPSEADFTRVNFFRQNLNEIKVLPPNPQKSLVSVLISGSSDPQKRILEVNYTHFQISETDACTYPLKSVEQAWQEVKDNKLFLANFGQNYDGQVVIKEIYLAYFDPPDEQNFLLPIYVFEGDRDFLGYVGALDPKVTN